MLDLDLFDLFDPDALLDPGSEEMLLLMSYAYGLEVEELRRRLEQERQARRPAIRSEMGADEPEEEER